MMNMQQRAATLQSHVQSRLIQSNGEPQLPSGCSCLNCHIGDLIGSWHSVSLSLAIQRYLVLTGDVQVSWTRHTAGQLQKHK